MGKKKGARAQQKEAQARKEARTARIVDEWNEYFQDEDELANWQRLCGDLNLPDNLPSKTQCRKALWTVNINIVQFLRAKKKDDPIRDPIRFFPTKNALVEYTIKKPARCFPKEWAKKMGPVRALLKHMCLSHKGEQPVLPGFAALAIE